MLRQRMSANNEGFTRAVCCAGIETDAVAMMTTRRKITEAARGPFMSRIVSGVRHLLTSLRSKVRYRGSRRSADDAERERRVSTDPVRVQHALLLRLAQHD